jgi:ubiquinone/menaquinone biosynthesis C-methylase UbiE
MSREQPVDMVRYYRDRAKEYEEVYEWRDAYRQEEQTKMGLELSEALKNKRILDIGCGTGYWTQKLSTVAKNITGIDVNEAVLEIARSKQFSCPVEFLRMDAYDMRFPDDHFTGVLASFWLSHIPRQKINDWIRHMHSQLEPGAQVFIVDNTYISGLGGELVRKPNDMNTYKLRTLNDGSQHLIIKNYFETQEITEIFGRHSRDVSEENIFMGNCFWWINYKYTP